jgi:16S rRNA (cytosine1402-N4)-methyltransferase
MFLHKPVLLNEILSGLAPRDGGRYVDATLGGAGHAEAILKTSSPTGWLYGFDRDASALEAARERLAPYAGRFELFHSDFGALAQRVPAASCDGVLMDLGVSSPQIDQSERGFSFQKDGPLDMRMDRRQDLTAARLVNEAEPEELARILWEFGGEPQSRRIARALVHDRQSRPFETTVQLASLIERVCPRGGRKAHPATRTFQALRIAVNDEMSQLKLGLTGALEALRPGGRLAVITFHSLEDRAVKEFGRHWSRDYEPGSETDVPELRRPRPARLRRLCAKAIAPGPDELEDNPRSRSAQLRLFEKCN